MQWFHEIDTWIVVVGVLSAMSCALLGNFLVLRQMSMMGDAISHAVLPGLAAGFLLTNNRASVTMFIGAAVVGILTALFTHWIHSLGKVDRGASMGVVFTTLFAVGLIMIVRAADHVDLDPGCVLYGAIELTPLDLINFVGVGVPRAAVVLSVVLLINTLFVLFFFKELKISSFDPTLATTLGINAQVMHYLLMTLVAVTTVASFESIGSILVIAMLIVPAAAAHLLTDRLLPMILVSVVVAALSAGLGHVAAITVPGWFGFVDTTTSGMMAVVAGLLFGLTVLFAPRHGLLSKAAHRAALGLRIVKEDALGLLYRLEELSAGEQSAMAVSLLGQAKGVHPALARLALARLRAEGKVTRQDKLFNLTAVGRTEAINLVRTHRLWESFLHKHLKLPVDHLHLPAERLEHITDPRMQQELADAADRPAYDPQGKPVPPPDQGLGQVR